MTFQTNIGEHDYQKSRIFQIYWHSLEDKYISDDDPIGALYMNSQMIFTRLLARTPQEEGSSVSQELIND